MVLGPPPLLKALYSTACFLIWLQKIVSCIEKICPFNVFYQSSYKVTLPPQTSNIALSLLHRHNDTASQRPSHRHPPASKPNNSCFYLTSTFLFIVPECVSIFQHVFLSLRFLGIPRIPNDPMDARQFWRLLKIPEIPKNSHGFLGIPMASQEPHGFPGVQCLVSQESHGLLGIPIVSVEMFMGSHIFL